MAVGVVPSVVKRIVAPAVVVDSVTLCAVVYVPATTLKIGVATVPVTTYVADTSAESTHRT